MTPSEALESYPGCALFPAAEAPIKPSSFSPHGAILLALSEIAKIASKGTWVSGRAIIYSDRFAFEPDSISLRTISGDIALSVPIIEIASVTLRVGVPVDYVYITTKKGAIFKLKCYDAKQLADSLGARTRS